MRITCALLLVVLLTSSSLGESGVGSNGIKSAGLTLPGGGALNGADVQIGQVEGLRAGRRIEDGGVDTAPNSAAAVKPLEVYMKTAVATVDGFRMWAGFPPNQIDHGQMVASIMISTDGSAPGVAPNAGLHSASYAVSSTTQRDAAQTAHFISSRNGDDIPAINMSFGMALDGGETTDGSSHLTRFVDWSAARQDVLYVVAGRELGGGDGPVPSDNYNGITVAASTNLGIAGNTFAPLWDGNVYTEDAGGEDDDRVSVDLLAPGALISTVRAGGAIESTRSGTSFAAPHVTGAVALLQQYAKHQITNAGWNDLTARRHELMKAILLNSADKLDEVHGSTRDILNKDNQAWPDTPAYNSPTMPLDMSFGAGHLNVSSAVTNFAAGEHESGTVPNIGWDFSSISEGSTDYVFDTPVAAGEWIAATLTWDRIVESSEVNQFNYTASTDFFNNTIEHELVDLNLSLLDSNDVVVYSSQSLADSVEHIFWKVPEGDGGTFKLRVTNAGNGNEWPEGYGLASWAGEAPESTLGDFNNDGNVNDADLTEWKAGFGTTYDGADFLDWQRNYGTTPITAVPEPSAILLSVLGLAAVCRLRLCSARAA